MSATTDVNNQEKNQYHKLATDEENMVIENNKLKDSNHRLSVEVKLNDVGETRESNTDDSNSLKSNPVLENGEHDASSVKNLNSSKLSINGGVNGVKKLDEDEDEEEDNDSFMFGMSKLRTFFFFLSLSLLVAFVLIFVFVLPCSENAQMAERTNRITDSAAPGSLSKLGDMDSDGKDDIVYFEKATQEPNESSRHKRDANDKDQCIVDGELKACVGDIVIVSSKTGSPIGRKPVGLTPEESLKCATGGDQRKKLSCAFQNGYNTYIVDMKATKSNVTSVSTEGCTGSEIQPVSSRTKTDNYGFIQRCIVSSTEEKIYFIGAVTRERSEISMPHSGNLMQFSVEKACEKSGSSYQNLYVALYADQDSNINVDVFNFEVNTGSNSTVFEFKTDNSFKFKSSGNEMSWQYVMTGDNVLVYSKNQVVFPNEEVEDEEEELESKVIEVTEGEIKYVATDPDFEYVALTVCKGVMCHYNMYTVDDIASDSTAPSSQTVEFTMEDTQTVHYIRGKGFKYFTAWVFKELESESESEAKKTEEDASKDDSSDVENETNGIENLEKRDIDLKDSDSDPCEGKGSREVTLVGFAATVFDRVVPIYTTKLCPHQEISVVGVSDMCSKEPIYTVAITGAAEGESVDSIVMPDGTIMARAATGDHKLPWVAVAEE